MTSDETSRLRDQIDLLVDAELEEPERKALLLRLDVAPDGWKHCALAFLESQMFKLSLRQWRDCVTPTKPSTRISTVVQKRSSSRWSPMILVILLLAFLGGMGLSGYWFQQPPFPSQENPPTMAGVLPFPMAEVPHLVNVSQDLASFHSTTVVSPFITVTPKIQRENEVLRTEYVTLPQTAGVSTMAVPCYLASDIEADRYLKSPPRIAPNEQEFIRRHGNEVNVYREHFVVPAGKKRHAVIPIDHVIVNYLPELNVL